MSTYDTDKSKQLICDPWNGSRTLGFLKFKRDFAAGMGAHFLHEDEYSLWQACIDTDQGGNAQGADPMPGANQNGHTNALRRRKRHWRSSDSFSGWHSTPMPAANLPALRAQRACAKATDANPRNCRLTASQWSGSVSKIETTCFRE